MQVPVQHQAHAPALAQDRAELTALLDEADMWRPLEPSVSREILLRRAVVHEHHRRRVCPVEILAEPAELLLAHGHVAILAFTRVEHDEVETAAIERVMEPV